ncbi:sigma-70 family RNA polymerase sigma factor [Clostridium cylindrosporum]|uniref:RNA polymerase sigma factor, sigma-70 family n=1 Tax=Clostridium cylindrosporum DSM 605 TaxID=1121307 RepID=A0A0J8DAM9_CLOCY|nr:sigma-70 family RNA polymerase sigma factor [Clostridium cylindrosporum]KMT22902.1 RNA polymerase sigma factor, sigma-70 family [Clostridium cylindrosporum DSM 605]
MKDVKCELSEENSSKEVCEIQRLLRDAKESVVSLEALVNKFMPLILKAAKYYCVSSDILPDAISEGSLAFIRCIEKYPLDSPIPFPYYAKRAVYSHIRYYCSKEITRHDNTISIHSPVNGCDDITLEDTISSEEGLEDEFFRRSSFLEIIDYIQNLNDLEREVLERHYFLGHSLKKISEDLGYSYRGIKYAKSRGIKLLQSEFEGEGKYI